MNFKFLDLFPQIDLFRDTLLISLWLIAFPFSYQTQAQISGDNSLSTQVTTEDNLNFTITEGDRAGNNLFHSFQEFSVPLDGSAIFNNSTTIENIINRVTGDFSSNIDGLIKAQGSTNVFLINPNGIIFGENAALDIGGSFLATTAESFLFEDGIEFSTRSKNSQPLLTINVPLGVRFGNKSATITNLSQTTTGLSVVLGKTLALVGGNINIDGGTITASQGKIELGSVAENNVVNFDIATDIWSFNYEKVSQFQNIVLDNSALVTASGIGGGEIHFQGKEIRVLNGSGISSDTFGSIDGRDITINASELLEINGSDPTNTFLDDALEDSSGILAPRASRITTNTVNTGNLVNTGNGGNINIFTKDLRLLNGAEILLQTIGNPNDTQQLQLLGQGGNLSIDASESIQINGNRPFLGIKPVDKPFILINLETSIAVAQASIISTASVFSNNSSGKININAKNMTIEDGGLIGSNPLSSGDGEDITIKILETLKVIGVGTRNSVSGSIIAANAFGQGSSGDIDITANQIILSDGGSISSSALEDSSGNAGNITINTSNLDIAGESKGLPSRINSGTASTGNGGDLIINANSLTIRDQGVISVQGDSLGAPGNVEITADSIELKNNGRVTAATISGQGGNIKINVEDNLIIRNNSQISSEASGIANGGNIDISADFVIALPPENGDIIANAIRGDGGKIKITTEGIVGLIETEGLPNDNLSEINASSEFGQDGSVTIVIPESETLEPERDVKTEVASLDKNSLDNYCRNLGKSKYNVTGRGGIPFSSEQKTSVVINWEDWRILEDAGRSEVNSHQIQDDATSLVSQTSDNNIQLVQGWFVNEQGQIILTAEPLVITPHPQQITNLGC
ncbi:filamentous hemagglutinin family N-terminal domain [Xenococcus sp. PCC 7305]|uniref:two-partner secretion domain-containing protein n=1 Tax=Xenococcus sp. PCC 7305 TaxID=102125 RepID=UPI0002ABEDDF|nr:filamentous hemagglutinin N-terminal domain-containing protein [Xenococcus sp. PCC 7305]ELS01325.1 filamentous hemagglutinin family N-terminal domain [Xenococcus sp. PCC 7305]